jgi:hypothetical protein
MNAYKHGSRAEDYFKLNDVMSVSSWASEAVMFLMEWDVMGPKADNEYMPQGIMTRAEAITQSMIVVKYLNRYHYGDSWSLGNVLEAKRQG